MNVGIIAAGHGERLQAGGYLQPKPLVPVAGRPLIDHVLAAIEASGLTNVACIVNEQSRGIEDHCRTAWPSLDFNFVRRTTPSSMESLFTLRPLLGLDGQADRFILLTVDAILPPRVLRGFIDAATRCIDADVVLAVTDYIDDEKPLWVQCSDDGRVTALGDAARGSGLVTAGFYVYANRIYDEVEAARTAGFTALRQFLAHLLARGYRVAAASVGKTVDVDRPEDIATAEAFIRGGYQ